MTLLGFCPTPGHEDRPADYLADGRHMCHQCAVAVARGGEPMSALADRYAPKPAAHNADAALREAREALIGAIEKASKRFTEKGIIF